LVHATINRASRRLSVFYATDCRVSDGPDGLAVATMIPIAEGVDMGTLLVERMRWEAFARSIEPRHTAAVAALAVGHPPN
jgi:hypothetical protein